MAASAAAYIARGMVTEQASELASQIEGTNSVARLIAYGFPVTLANEISAQMTAGTGVETNLMALGLNEQLAPLVAADITTAGAH